MVGAGIFDPAGGCLIVVFVKVAVVSVVLVALTADEYAK